LVQYFQFFYLQEHLFTRIQEGFFDFPENEWSEISDDAKTLIQKLLVRDPRKRLSAKEVLNHPWVVSPPPPTPLATPRVLTRLISYSLSFDFLRVSIFMLDKFTLIKVNNITALVEQIQVLQFSNYII